MQILSKTKRRGQATVELALVMPILLIVVIGIFEFGRAWNVKQVVTDAAREGARTGALYVVNKATWPSDTCTKVVQARLATAGVSLPSGQPVITPDLTGATVKTGDQVTVDLSVPYTFTFLGPLLSWTTGQSNISISTRFTMRIE